MSICLAPAAQQDHLSLLRCSSKWKKSEEWPTPGGLSPQLRSSIASFHLLLLTFLHYQEALESHTLLLHCTVSLEDLDINYLCSCSLALLTQPGMGWKSFHSHISLISISKTCAWAPSCFQAFIQVWKHNIYPEREKEKTGLLTSSFLFFFQQINQMPLITQMIEIQLFAEWYTVLINLNLHCMSLELMFLFLIRRNLAGGSDWINRSRFLYSWSVNRRGVTSALGPPYLVGALSSASCQGQAHWRQSGQRRQITLQDDLLQLCQNETHKMATVTPKIAPGVFTW